MGIIHRKICNTKLIIGYWRNQGMGKTGIIINPNAKKFRTKKSSLKSYTSINSDLLTIRATESADDIAAIIHEFKKDKCSYIGVAGGDGTLHLAVTELIKIYDPGKVPPLLILREGTMDNVARTIKLNGRGPDLIRRLLWAIENNKKIEIHSRDTIKIDDRYCFLFGTGIVANFLNEVYSGKEKGLVRNIQVAFSAFAEGIRNEQNGRIFSWMDGEIHVDNEMIKINPVNGILAGTVEHIGMGFSPLITAGTVNNTFQLLITAMSPLKLLKNLNKIRTGQIIDDEGYLNTSCRKLKLIYNSDFDYTMDGDMYRAEKELLVETGPAIKLIKV
jgi:diacylglycerol kinase family enzyme